MSNSRSNQDESGPLPEISNSASPDILAILKDVASRDSVAGVSVWCLKCLEHADEEIRQWASEAMSESVLPSADEATQLISYSEDLTKRWQNRSPNPAPDQAFADTDGLFFAVKLLGRLDTSDTETRRGVKECLRKIANLESPSDSSPLLAVVQRAQRESERLS